MSDRLEEVTLREYFEDRCNERMRQYTSAVLHLEQKLMVAEKTISDRFEWLEAATKVQTGTLEKRLDGMNGFRGALADQAGTFFTIQSHEIFRDAVEKELRSLREFKSELAGKASQQNLNLTLGMSALAFIASIIGLVKEFVR